MKRRLLRILSITSLVAMLLFTMAGIALAVDYYLYVKVSSESETSYAPLALVVDLSNQSLADLGYISESGLDTRVTYAGSELKHMVAEDKLAFVAPEVKGGVDYSYNYTMGNDPLTEFYIIPGYDGYVTVAEGAALEPGNNFEFEWDGYIDTASGSDKNLVYKAGAVEVYISAAGSITANILSTGSDTFYPDPHIEVSSVDGFCQDQGNDITWVAIRAEPGNDHDDAGSNDFATRIYASTTTDQWNALARSIILFDTSSMPAGATATSATLSVKNLSTSDGLGITPDLNVFSSAPTANDDLVDGDFDSVGTTAFSTAVPYGDMSAGVFNDFVLNSAGLAAIDADGVSKFAVYNANYDASGTPPSWTSGQQSYIKIYLAESIGDPKLVVNYQYPAATVTATGVSSGEHKVKVTADGTDLKIYIDDVEKDSTALSGASVPDNSNNWTLIQGNVAPYLAFYKHTVSSTLIAWYQPNDMISGTTLPDREGTAQNGIITWGSLPTGITTDTGSLKIVNLQKISKEVEEGAYLELFEEAPPEWEGMYEGEEYNVLPGSEAISELAAAGQIPIKLFWVPVIFGIAIFAGLFIYGKTRNIMAVAIAGGIVIGLFCAIGMLVWWVIIPYSIMAVALCVSEKTYGF